MMILSSVVSPHQDALVVTVQIANYGVSRILVDNGSSVNLITVKALEEMDIKLSDVVRNSSVLVGFSGETRQTVGEIRLPVYLEGMNSMERFCVIDCPSPYNAIFGRPWLHNMQAVPSTYHQCVKMPTPWGIGCLRGDQNDSKDCYQTFYEEDCYSSGSIAIKEEGP